MPPDPLLAMVEAATETDDVDVSEVAPPLELALLPSGAVGTVVHATAKAKPAMSVTVLLNVRTVLS